MNNTIILASVVSLIIGLGIGHFSATHRGGYMDMDRHRGHEMMNNSNVHNNSEISHMDSMMDDMMKALAGKTGPAFDEAFLREMIIHHEGAVAMAQAALTAEARPEIITLSNEIIAAQEREIAQMKEWQTTWTETTD
jgi:uncharacterized protein (DUF305 family)